MPRRSPVVLALAALAAVLLASTSSGQTGPPGGAPPGLDKAIAAKEKHAERLLDVPGVAGIGVGANAAGRAVVEIYKERPEVADLPATLEGVPVEFATTGVLEPRDHSPSHRFERPVPIGVSAGLAGVATGTLGVRVTDGTNVYALSNNHVFAGINGASVGDPIISPGDVDGGNDPTDRIGTLHDYQVIDFNGGPNTMDAAIALTSTANVGTATPADGYGTPSPVTTPAFVGQAVQKYGRTTGLQLGSVAATNVSVDVCYLLFFEICLQEARFESQISVSPGPFSAPGDSGSLIVTQGTNQPVALLFAGGDGLTIGSPIDPVLQRFGVTIDGTPPVDGPPSAPTSLSATPGDAQVSLSWNAPGFDGGSPVTGYRVYRGTSPASLSQIAQLGVQTGYPDSTVVSGQIYYYEVSALNANGEGPRSSQVQATPVALVPPLEPLSVLDNFDDGFENPLSDQGRWTNGVNGSAETGLYVPSIWLACSKSTTCTSWRSNTQYGPDSEVYGRVATLPGDANQVRLYARLQQPGTATFDAYMLRTNQLAGTDEVYLERVDNGAFVRLLTINQELVANDTLLLRVQGQVLEAWRLSGGAWTRLGFVSDTTYGATGYVGVGLRGTIGRVDDFGGRGLGGSTVPTAPTSLSATPGDAQVSLSWNAPGFDGGSPVTGYRVYRGTSPASLSQIAQLGVQTGYPDSTVVSGQIYYYEVSALNANGEGPRSSQVQATPVALVPPLEPLSVLDNFDDGFENPLSDQGRWTNGVNGSAETGLYVPSIWLACSKSTTCTSWRSNTQYGPDSEVYGRVATLPGDANQVRLYARLQQPGTATFDAYMLRTNQLAGTDEVYLERVDNGAFVRLLTINQELVANDTLLLRVQGQVLEAWRLSGGAWTRLGFVSDTTYGATGYVGVGLRGTIGRVDDFGGRTMGVPPPDTEPPSAPGTLSASALSSTQIDLAWGPATDNVGVALYRIERCEGAGCATFAEVATTTATSYSDSGVSASTDYSYRVRAEDGVPNLGPYSNTASAATPAPPDTEPPSAPGTLSASALSSTQIDLAWGPATDNVGVALYRIERCEGAGCATFAEVATTTATSYSDSGVSASTDYSYRVRAEDGVPNLGPYSNTASAATPAPPDTEPPSAPGTLSASALSSTQIDLAWGPATDNVGVALYRIERCEGAGCATFAEVATTTATSYSDSGVSASTDYSYRVRAEDGVPNLGPYSNTASAATPASPRPLYFSLFSNGTVGALAVANEDVVSFDGVASFSLAFDGSDVGLSSRRLDAFSWLDADTLLFSLDTDGAALPGVVGTIDDSDIVRFDATSLGETTSGAFSLHFDGSDVGLTTNAEDVDAFELLANGQLLVSTQGSVGVTGVSGADEDLLAFTPATLGPTTSGAFSMYFDGSDVGLSTSAGEDIDAAAVDAAGRIYLSTLDTFAVPGVSGDDEDVFVFTPATLGTTTAGAFAPALYFDGSAFGLAANDVFAIDLPAAV